jgi:DNA-binding HxlR family transcriptional regulator
VARLCRYEVVREIVFGLENADQRPRELRRDRKLARSSLYNHVDQLFDLGIVVRRDAPGAAWEVTYEHGENGPEFHGLLRDWERLLGEMPGGSGEPDWDAPLHFGEAWAVGLVQAMLDGPLTMGQMIAACVGRATRSQIERLLRQLHGHGCLGHADRRYSLLDLGRQAIGELAASARFERRHMEGVAAPITATDGADALRGTLPLIELPGQADGTCEFVVRARKGEPETQAAVCWLEIEGGRITAIGAGNAAAATSWAQGTIDDWLGAVIDHRAALLKSTGDRRLGRDVVRKLHTELYGRRG